jgi:SSS family solute:Na+ symporter
MVQAFILLIGTVAVTWFGLYQLGGWDEMINIIATASKNNGNPPVERFFNLWRPISDTEYPWTGMLFGAPILGVWYWCTDQYIVQRALSAKNVLNARRGALFAGFLKLLPVFIFFIPGVIAYALAQNGQISFSMDNADQALPTMITNFLPVGIKGLAIAGLLAALMSSLSSAFNSSSTLLTIDFYQQKRPDASEKELVRFGQIATSVLVIISLGWIPFMKSMMGGGIFHYLQNVQAYIAPPIAAVFLFGLFYKWINARGAIITLWTGFALGILRLVTEFLRNDGTLVVSENTLFGIFLDINFLHFALYLFLFCAGLLMLVSKMGVPQSMEKLQLVTFQKNASIGKIRWTKDVIITLVLVVLVLVIWVIFSPLGIGG